MKDLSIIIVSYNTVGITKNCIDSIRKYTKKVNYELIVVDNASTDGSVEYLKKKSTKIDKLILNKKNVGFGGGNNQGLAKATGKYILLLNSDTVLDANILKEMLFWMEKNTSVGISTCKLLNSDKTIQGTGGYFPTLPRVFTWMTIQDLPLVDLIVKPYHPQKSKSFFKNDNFYKKSKELDWVTGAFLLMRREVYEKVGDFDTDYFMYVEEVDFCYRAKKEGFKIRYLPKWSITHLGGASGKVGLSVINEFKGVKLFYKKHFESWKTPILRAVLKIGAFWRIFYFGLVEGKESAKIYEKAFKII